MLKQTPSPQNSYLYYQGDLITITLSGIPANAPGQAFLRTNLGNGEILRQEIIDETEKNILPLGRAWQDLPMTRKNSRSFSITLPLHQVGFFAAKAFFLPENSQDPLWPEGGNTNIKVEPAGTVSQNNIYNAFVRQFGPNKNGGFFSPDDEKKIRTLDEKGYTVIPPSGTFRRLNEKIDFIIRELGFRIIQLLPIQPTPTTFARMGRFGSPFAPRDFFSVDPSLADFDQTYTPQEQARQLFQNIHIKGGLVFLDMPVDHTGWASLLQTHHPEYFTRTEDGKFASPGAWGVVWADLCKLDFSNHELWKYLADVFLYYCRLGVDGFRCDAGYMIPVKVWKYLTAKVRQEYPDTIFFLEGLGGPLKTTSDLLQDANLNWAYSEQFQTYDAQALRDYSTRSLNFSRHYGTLMNFAETHDNNRLAARSYGWARLRTGLAALSAPAGAFGIANGVEWLATEKIDVHGSASLNWGATPNLCQYIQTLNHLLKYHPAFEARAEVSQLPRSTGENAVAFLRTPTCPYHQVLAVICTSDQTAGAFHWPVEAFQSSGHRFIDLITGMSQNIPVWDGYYHLTLQPSQTLCLTSEDNSTLPFQENFLTFNQTQRCRAILLDTLVRIKGYCPVSPEKVNQYQQQFLQSPEAFLKELFEDSPYLPVITWQPDTDSTRMTIVPPGHLLLIRHDRPFKISLHCHGRCLQQQFSLPEEKSRKFCALLCHLPESEHSLTAFLQLEDEHTLCSQPLKAPLHICGIKDNTAFPLSIRQQEITDEHCGLLTTENSGYSLCRAEWGALHSSYDALLAANLSDSIPVDRTAGLICCRLWILQHGYSRELNKSCQTEFAVLPQNRLRWSFMVPSHLGEYLSIQIILLLNRQSNQAVLQIIQDLQPSANQHSNTTPVTIVLRPFIDYRSNHGHTKAYLGAENHFRNSIRRVPSGFTFSPDSRFHLQTIGSQGKFMSEPEWEYQHFHKIDAERGLDAEGDLFSPGYFTWNSTPGTVMELRTGIFSEAKKSAPPMTVPDYHQNTPMTGTSEELLRQSMDSYICRRDEFSTVIAGYPWFLDWGRDTLICLRGMIAAGKQEEAENIIRQFASFEEKGTIPNMIRGNDVRNRETSDAPLWLFVAADDFNRTFPEVKILQSRCGEKTLLEHLISIAEHYQKGTTNGIRMCGKTGLIFSPSHYTWMDTNYPAGTPREGYPIEIQALWHAAVRFLYEVTGRKCYHQRAEQIRNSILKYYTGHPEIGLSDCLHAPSGISADQATPDDACRSNQLLAITLGALPTNDPICGNILNACQHLIFPGGIRSLAKFPVSHPIIIESNGHALNDPYHPYWGQYAGDEDTRRKPAYHNGTGWGWQMPSYCEAMIKVWGDSARSAAAAILDAVRPVLLHACLGHISEIFDGDYPHMDRGCPAQAWSVTEFYRMLKDLHQKD